MAVYPLIASENQIKVPVEVIITGHHRVHMGLIGRPISVLNRFMANIREAQVPGSRAIVEDINTSIPATLVARISLRGELVLVFGPDIRQATSHDITQAVPVKITNNCAFEVLAGPAVFSHPEVLGRACHRLKLI